MRKVVLSDSDFALFDHDIRQEDYDFYQRHKDAFRRMWIEQGKRYWVRFVMTFRSFTVNHGIIKDFPGKPEKYDTFVDQAFIYVHEQFVEGKFGSAKKFIMDIFILAQNRHTIQYMESKSYAKDPFYNKDTRDVFRSFFGPASEKSSYIKVYFLLPIYLRVAGSVFNCLRRWLDAADIGDGEDESSWWTAPNPGTSTSSKKQAEAREKLMADVNNAKTPAPTDEEIAKWWKQEEEDSLSKGPKYVPFWSYGDPRVIDEDNPLYNPDAIKTEADWRMSVDFHKYKNFVLYVHRYINPANETEADLYHMADEGIVVFYPQLPGHEDRPYDQLQIQAVESFKEVLDKHANGKWSHGLPRAAHINREHGRQQVVLFDYKLNPDAKTSIKGTVLDSISMNNQLNPEGIQKGPCGHETTLTPVVLSPVEDGESSEASKKKNKRNRKKKKNGSGANGDVNGNDCDDDGHGHGMCGRTDHHKPHVIQINHVDPNCSTHGHGDRACGLDHNPGHGHYLCSHHPNVVATKDRKTNQVHVTCGKCGEHYGSVPSATASGGPSPRREKHILVRKAVKGGDGKEVALHMVTSQKPHINPHSHQECCTMYKKNEKSNSAKRSESAVGHESKPASDSPVSRGNKVTVGIQTDPEPEETILPDLLDSIIAASSSSPKHQVATLKFNPTSKQLKVTKEKKEDSSDDEDSSSSGEATGGKLLDDSAMKQLAEKLHEMNYAVDKIEQPKSHKVQIIKDDEKADKAKRKKKDSVNIRFTFNNDAAEGDVEALAETKKTFTQGAKKMPVVKIDPVDYLLDQLYAQEVATIVKSNMGDQPTLPRNLENMVRQECRKEHARERLRKKHEMRKQTSGTTSSSMLDSLDEGPSPTSEKTMDFPDPPPIPSQKAQTGGHTTQQQLTERLAEMGIEPPKSFDPEVMKVAEKILPPKPRTGGAEGGGAKMKEVKSEDKSQSSEYKKKGGKFESNIPTPDQLKMIQDLLKEEYKERFSNHHMSDAHTLVVGQKGPNIQIVIPTKKSPAEVLRENSPVTYKAHSIIFDTPTEKAEVKDETVEKESENGAKPRKLRSCAYCGEVEPSPRTFKKCQRCKAEGIKKARYYCGRTCQVDDWGVRHKEEHQENQLQ